jgi:hypothetical protein
MDPAPLRGNGDAFAAAPGDRPNIGVPQSASPKHGLGRGLKIIDQPWQRVAEKFGRALQTTEMLLAQKQAAVIGADSFEDRADIVQRVRQNMQRRLTGRQKRPVEPDGTRRIDERGLHGFGQHSGSPSSRMVGRSSGSKMGQASEQFSGADEKAPFAWCQLSAIVGV